MPLSLADCALAALDAADTLRLHLEAAIKAHRPVVAATEAAYQAMVQANTDSNGGITDVAWEAALAPHRIAERRLEVLERMLAATKDVASALYDVEDDAKKVTL